MYDHKDDLLEKNQTPQYMKFFKNIPSELTYTMADIEKNDTKAQPAIVRRDVQLPENQKNKLAFVLENVFTPKVRNSFTSYSNRLCYHG